jgi:(p)ppGpp synthase/HD superfamily hydrolase
MLRIEERQIKIIEFVKKAHEGQVRKYTGEPYHTHCFAVMGLVRKFVPDNMVKFEMLLAAACHDVLEDTKVTEDELLNFFLEVCQTPTAARFALGLVSDLSNEYEKFKYPDLNRKERKLLEAQRLGKCIPAVQAIKCADLIDNTSSIVEYDPEFAKTYLNEKSDLLSVMKDAGEIRDIAYRVLSNANQRLQGLPDIHPVSLF